jgi:hypothetical protein
MRANLPPRGSAFDISVERVTVRNQRTRWGSCSQRGTISLNRRLIQTPEIERDYIILHVGCILPVVRAARICGENWCAPLGANQAQPESVVAHCHQTRGSDLWV